MTGRLAEGAGRRVDRPDDAPRRVPELDAIRGLACLLVLVYHFKPHAVPGGWAAVDVFFLLSGYLITAILLKNAGGPRFLAHFYARRGLRIWPVYYLAVALVAAASPFLPRGTDFAGLPYVLTYTQNLPKLWSGASPEFSPYLSHAWSLAVEEQFYLAWPLAVVLAGRRRVVPLALAMLAASVGARASGVNWWLLPARADGLALGALLAALQPGPDRTGPRTRSAFAAIALAALGYLGAVTATGGMSTVGPPRWPGPTLLAVNLAAFGAVGLVLCHEGRPALGVLRRRGLVWLGTVSYGLYMAHYPAILLSDDLANRLGMRGRPFWREALTAAVIVGLAALSWRYVERPLLRLKDRFPYQRPGRPAPHPANPPLAAEPSEAGR